MKTVEIGKVGEKQAVRYLKKCGYKIVATNVHISHNEIDIIAKNKEFIVFVEVKTRSTGEDMHPYFGTPAQAVTYAKKQRTITAARSFLNGNEFSTLQPRFDVIEVYVSEDHKRLLNINHIINAFGA